ncbi:MAG: DUF1801 domain-containing protein [Bacteroidota bacterium]
MLKYTAVPDEISESIIFMSLNYKRMAYKNKTTQTDVDVLDFLNSYVDQETKKQDSFRLLELMQSWSGFEPKIWGSSIIGFGSYHYKYKSGHEGDAPLIGFSPRKNAISLYVMASGLENKKILENLGKFKMGKACIYVKKLQDIDIKILEQLCIATMRYLTENHECACRE